MHVERLLSLVKAASVSKVAACPDAERMCSAGMLTQASTAHCNLGMSDPRYQTRADLLAANAPVRCNKQKRHRKTIGLFAYVRFIRRQRGLEAPLCKQSYSELLKECAATFADLPQHEKDEYSAEESKEPDEESNVDGGDDALDYERSLRAGLMGHGSRSEPYSSKALEDEVRIEMGRDLRANRSDKLWGSLGIVISFARKTSRRWLSLMQAIFQSPEHFI